LKGSGIVSSGREAIAWKGSGIFSSGIEDIAFRGEALLLQTEMRKQRSG